MKSLAYVVIFVVLVVGVGRVTLKYLPPTVNLDQLHGEWHADTEPSVRWRFEQDGSVQFRSQWPTLNGSEERQQEGSYEIVGRGTTGHMELRITWAGKPEGEVWQIASLNNRALLLVAPNGTPRRYRSAKTQPPTSFPRLG